MMDCLRIGEEKQPVLVIDDFLPDPEAARLSAAKQAFRPLGPYYPGIRAPYEVGSVDRSLTPYLSEIRDVFGIETEISSQEAAWSLVTIPPAELAPIQRLPHIDGTDRQRLAVLVYVSGEEVGGTAFYRHRSTGFESVDQARYPRFAQQLEQDVAKHGLPEAAYLTASTPLFEQIGEVSARPGRAVIYSGTSLHSGLILKPEQLSNDPLSGRLTINAFVGPRAAKD